MSFCYVLYVVFLLYIFNVIFIYHHNDEENDKINKFTHTHSYCKSCFISNIHTSHIKCINIPIGMRMYLGI